MKRNFLLFFIISAALLFSSTVVANQRSGENISVDLVLNSMEEKDKTEIVSDVLIIRNSGSTEVKVRHPGNRCVAFVIMDSLGNVVSPKNCKGYPTSGITINQFELASFPNFEF